MPITRGCILACRDAVVTYKNRFIFVKRALYNSLPHMIDFTMKYGEKSIQKAKLEIWDNPKPERDYEINISYPEVTCLCPRSGYPDFAVITVTYTPDRKIVELKSLKLYLNSFRNMHISHEEITNEVFGELEKKLKPRFLEVVGDFNPRGNVKTFITIRSKKRKGS